MESSYTGLYFGVIEAVIPPGDPLSISKYQYEYQLLVTAGQYAQIPCRAVQVDPFGSLNDYEDRPLSKGNRVYVMFPRGDTSLGAIIGGGRQFHLPTDDALGHHWARRFNEIMQTVDKDGAWTLSSLNGPLIKVEKTKITIDNGAGDSVIFDAANKNITVASNAMNINVEGDTNITVKGDTNITGQGNVVVEGKSIKLGKDASDAVLKGDTFKGIFEKHQHPTAVGPSGPPIVPVPPTALSTKVKTE